jgi:hypothetical protein
MKKLTTLLLALMFLSLTFPVNAQQDTVMLKIKYEKFKSWKKTGKILTLTGGALAVIGTGLIVWMVTADDTGIEGDAPMVLSSVACGGGTLILIPGAIYWGIGNSKTREYKLRLENIGTGFFYNPGTIYAPNSAGIVLAYRF